MDSDGPLLMGTQEIRDRLGGVSRQRAYQITTRPDFPKPIVELAQGKVWLASQVEEWMAEHRRD
ncbi:DNA-binding protein [Actinoplanes sp. NPDC023714]|uniref:helix-turn-helix transcriptional regulator n=1 Tax=Actinoplanes sp. NPDC023714 TaxID=3154322 RepID=UPI0033C7D8E1